MFGSSRHPWRAAGERRLHHFYKIGDLVNTPDGPGEIRGFATAESHGPGRGEYRWDGMTVDGPFVVLLKGPTAAATSGTFRGYLYDQLQLRTAVGPTPLFPEGVS